MKKNGKVYLSSLALLLIIFMLIQTNDASAATISMTTSGAQSINVMPDSTSSFGTNIGVDNLNIITDCKAGYNLSMSTSVSDNNLYLNGNISNNQSGTYFSPADGTNTLANSPNTWGYLLSDTTPTSSSIFSAVPTNANPAILKTTATTASATNINDSFNVYFGVAMSNGMTPGKYKMIPDANNSNADGSITYYLTMDTSCETRTITYNANNGSGSISPQVVQAGNSVVLADNAFTRTNYFFKGWSTNQNATTPEYRTNETITPASNMTLYAVWGDSTTTALYDAVASLTRGAQTNDNNASTGIKTKPTKATSGVYTYDSSVFGTSSDAANTSNIYYYRGILDTDLDGSSSTYGSNGNSMNYPNYVKLGDMCWRIVRTTGSGGVKMIYNGSYSGGTTANSCANATTNAQVATQIFGIKGNSGRSDWYYNVNRVGFTFNNTSSIQDSTTSTSADVVFGSDSDPSVNNERSNIKAYLEDTWYGNNMSTWTSKLEASAGYCDDRSAYSNAATTSAILTSVTPFTGGGIYYGSYGRNKGTSKSPSLTCPRDTVDLYRYVPGSTGVSNELKYPVALLTADEASFAGSGSSTANQGSGYHYSSYLRSGSYFWLISPQMQYNGSAIVFALDDLHGELASGGVHSSYVHGVRPVVSLKSGTTIESGSGTATSPWVIEEPKTMQNLTLSQCSVNVGTNGNPSGVGDEITVIDIRDGNDYTVRYINGECWMTQNLRLTGGSGTLALDSTYSNVSSYNMPAEESSSYFTESDNSDVHICSQDTSKGCWYNYYSATAGTVSGSSNSTLAASDICPKNWHLPTAPNTIANTDLNKLIGNTISGEQTTSTGFNAFNAVTGGFYQDGILLNSWDAEWWSATAANNWFRYSLGYNTNGGNTFGGDDSNDRESGLYVRCVKSS